MKEHKGYGVAATDGRSFGIARCKLAADEYPYRVLLKKGIDSTDWVSTNGPWYGAAHTDDLPDQPRR